MAVTTKATSASELCKLHGTTLTKEAEANGIDRRTLYNWFPSREQALVLLIKGALFTELQAIANQLDEQKK